MTEYEWVLDDYMPCRQLREIVLEYARGVILESGLAVAKMNACVAIRMIHENLFWSLGADRSQSGRVKWYTHGVAEYPGMRVKAALELKRHAPLIARYHGTVTFAPDVWPYDHDTPTLR